MLFWILFLFDLVITYQIVSLTSVNLFLQLILGFMVYFMLCALSGTICVFISLLLGKTDKLALRNKRRYYVTSEANGLMTLSNFYHNGKVLMPKAIIDEIRCDEYELCSYVEIEVYNTGGWRKWLLWDMYEDKYKYILYLPKPNEEES